MFRSAKLDRPWYDAEDGELTDLQEALQKGALTRDFTRIQAMFDEAGINVVSLFDKVVTDSPDQEIVVLDEGCGTGAGIEDFWHVMKARESLKGRVLHTIGVDENTLPHRIPPRILRKSRELHTEFIDGDAHKLDLADNSVHFGWSVQMLQYCQDPLRVFEEGYRVLKPGGIMLWLVNTYRDVSTLPLVGSILENTPGAEDNFRMALGNRYFPLYSALVCQKDPEAGFKGFPYELSLTFPRSARLGVDNSVDKFLMDRFYKRTDEVRGRTRNRALFLVAAAAVAMAMTCNTSNLAAVDGPVPADVKN